MKIKLFLCALLLAHSAHAELYDFNDIAVGTPVSSLSPFGAAVISTRSWATAGGTLVAESFAQGVINTGPNGSPSIVIESRNTDLPQEDVFFMARRNIEISVSFDAPISQFSVDAFSFIYSSPFIYSGINADGEAFTLSSFLPGGYGDEFTHLSFDAPTGGYITGFQFSQFESKGGITLAMDNLDYTTLAGASGLLTTAVPENIGLPTFVFTMCGILFFHRRMRTARK